MANFTYPDLYFIMFIVLLTRSNNTLGSFLYSENCSHNYSGWDAGIKSRANFPRFYFTSPVSFDRILQMNFKLLVPKHLYRNFTDTFGFGDITR